MREIEAMIAAEARRTRNHGMMIDAAACAIRERAPREALAAVRREQPGGDG